jgi:hypothetical protein
VPPLLAHRRGPFDLRSAVLTALGRVGDDRCLDDLRAASGDGDPWIRARALWALGRLGDASAVGTLRKLLTGTSAGLHQRVVVGLADLGDRYGRRLLRQGLTAGAAPIRQGWVQNLAAVQRDPVDSDLLSRYGDSIGPWLDSRTVIDPRRVKQMARLTATPADEVVARYRRLAKIVPLTIAP